MNGRRLLVAASFLIGCAAPEAVPTLRVEAKPFVQRVTADGTLEAKEVTALTFPSSVKGSVRLAWVAPEASAVEEGQVVARFDAGPFEERLDSGRSAVSTAEYRILEVTADGQSGQAGLNTQYGLSELELDLSRRFRIADESIWSRHEILESETDEELALDRMSHAESQLATQERRIRSNLQILEIEKRQATFEIEEAEDGLASLIVRSPHSGLFLRARDWRGTLLEVGQEVWAGRPVGEIPALDTLQAEVFVLEADAGGVVEGLEAEVVIESRPEEAHPARVARIDAMAQPRKNGSPVQYFEVTIELESTDPQLMKPGQRVAATIFLSRSESALVIPRQAVQEDGGETVVLVATGGQLVPRPVELGAGSRAQVEIVSGLEVGEVVALRSPTSEEPPSSEATP